MLSLQRRRAGQSRGVASSPQRPLKKGTVSTQLLSLWMFPCITGEGILIKTGQNQTSAMMSSFASMSSFFNSAMFREHICLLIVPTEKPSLHQETASTRNLLACLMGFVHLWAFLVPSCLFHDPTEEGVSSQEYGC